MNPIFENIREFDRELTRLFSLYTESVFEVGQSKIVQEVFIEILNLFITASKTIEDKYRQLNGAPGKSRSHVKRGANGGYYRLYENGAIYWHPQLGSFVIYGEIFKKYLQLGAEAGFLGYPVSDEGIGLDQIGRYSNFEGGSIHWSPSTGAHETHGAIRAKWGELGWEKSFLGYPTTDETETWDGIGRFNHFERGSIYWNPEIGAYEVHGAIHDKWASLGWETGYLGYPITDEHDDTVGRRVSRFQRGVILHSVNPLYTKDLPETVIIAPGPVHPDVPITGWVELTLNSAGFFSYKGHLHNSGFIGYHFAVASVLHFQDANGNVLAVSEEEHLGGTTSPEDSRDHDWQHNGFHQLIRDNWDGIKHSGMTTTLKTSVTAGDVINVILWSLPLAAVAVVAGLILSGDAKVCDPYIVEDEDPFTHEKRRSIHVPIRFKDPNNLQKDPCKY
jgi:hypothetical protein